MESTGYLGEAMKKKIWKKTAVLLAIVLLAGCNTTVSTDQNSEPAKIETLDKNHKIEDEPMYGKTIPIGYNGGLCTSAPGVAKAMGYFEEEGLDVEVVSAQAKVEAIGTGKVKLVTDHIATLLVPTVNGVSMTFLKGAHTGCKSLYVLADSGIESTKDLIGKTVAVPDGIGNSDHNIAMRFFSNDNIDPSELQFKQVETSAAVLAMQNGEVQGAVFSDQFAEEFVENGTLKIIRSLTYDEDFKKEPCCVHAFNTDFVKENPLIAEKMVNAIKKSSNYIANNTQEATQLLFDNNWASGDFDQAVRMMNSYNWEVTNEMADTSLKDIIEDYKTFGLIDKDKKTEDIMTAVWRPID